MKNKPNFLGFLLLIGLMASILWLRYADIFAQPNLYINLYGDGFKNYATMMYHVKHDSTYLHYDGMNYPYGEHLVFADGQPLIANTIKFICENIVDISEHTVAVINLSMLFSILLGAIFLYLLFIQLSLPWWYSVLSAIPITLMARQIEKITGHYGLSHVFVIPMFLYLLYVFEKKRSWKVSFLIGLLIFFAAQLHFYFFGIAVFLIGFYSLGRLLNEFSWQRVFFYFKHLSVQAILPFVLLQGLLSVGNIATDRPDTPTGFLYYRAKWEGIFTSPKFPFWKWIDENIAGIRQVGAEGTSYVGLVATIFLLIILFRWLFKMGQKLVQRSSQSVDLLPDVQQAQKDYIPALYFASISLLFLAHAFPFSLPGLEGLLQYAGPYKQFRGVGRFAWAFHFGFNVVVFYSLWHFGQKGSWKRIVMFLALGLVTYEAAHFTSLQKIKPQTRPELAKDFIEKKDSWLYKVNFKRFQAVLPLPYFHIGSENFQINEKGHMLRHSLVPGLNSGLPSLGVHMSRTSLSQSMKSIQLALEPYRYPTILDELPNDKPLLMVEDKEYMAKIGERFKHLKQGAILLQEDKKYAAVYEVPLHSFQDRIDARVVKIDSMLNSDSLYTIHNFYSTVDSSQFIYINYDNQFSTTPYLGTGGVTGVINEATILYEGHIPLNTPEQHEYTLSFWMAMQQDQYPTSIVLIEELDPETKKVLKKHPLSIKFEIQALDGKWGLFEKTLYVKDTRNNIRVSVKNKHLSAQPVYLDELLIRPKGVDFYQETEKYLWYNNRWFPKE